MTTRRTRRASKLVSPLVVAGLVLSAAPHALAADGGSPASDQAATLTSKQADQLAAHLNVDVYGDHAPTTGTEAADAPSPGGGSHLSDDASTPVTFTNKSTIEGVRGLGATVPGRGSDYFTVHSLGEVQLHKADGSTVWSRSNPSLYADWKITNLRPWQKEMYPARVVMGYDAVSPFSPYSDQGYDTSDLTGDGVPDIVFSASVGMNPPTGVTIPGTSMTEGTVVTVLDGKSGKTLWSKVYSYANLVKVVDGTLLVADSPRQNYYSPAGQTATLSGIRFSYADGALTPASTWTYDTQEAGAGAWSAIEAVADGKVAVSWSTAKAADVAAHGTTLVVDTADGSVAWQSDSDLYGRQLHLDAARDRIVALEQPDSSDGIGYQIASYDVTTGERTTLDSRDNAFATALTVGDAAAGGGTEYAVSESTYDSDFSINASTIRVLSGADGSTVKWTHTTKRDADNLRDAPSTWSMNAVGGMLVAAAQDDRDINSAENIGGLQYGALTAFNAKGKIAWRHDGLDASPMFHQEYRSGGADYVRVVDQNQNVHSFKLGHGKQSLVTPLQGDLNYAQAIDLNGDKHPDVVAGGNSDGVWAWSGPSLVKGAPQKLWQATVPGQVHNIATGDVNGDGRPEVVVAADTATVVLDGATGTVLTTIDGAGAYVRSVTVADVNGDGKDEILVPTDALRAYNARGKLLWTYSAPASAGQVVFADTAAEEGRVYAQYGSANGMQIDDAAQNGVALDGTTGAVLWQADPTAPARAADGRLHGALLDHAVFASPKIPYADGHAVVYTWIALIDPTTAGNLATATPAVVVELRDGRTGELLHQYVSGGTYSHGNFFIDGQGDPLYEMIFGNFRGLQADGTETRSSVAAPLRTAQFINGPGGRRLVAGGIEGGLAAYDPSALTSGYSFQSWLGNASVMGGRNYLAADLDGDGTDEMVSLNFDAFGINRMAEQLGGGVFSLDQAVHQLSVFKLS